MPRKEWMKKLSGVHVVMVTPFKSDTEIDEEAIRKNTNFLIDHGIKGEDGVLIPGGSIGECHAMSIPERKRLMEIVIEEAQGRVPVVPGCNHTGTNLVIELVKHAQKLGADGVMVIPPYYWEPSDEVILRHYQAISEATDIGIMVYNNQLVVRKDLSLELLDKLTDIPNVAWVKDCTPSFAKLRQTVERIGDRVGVINCLGALHEPYGYEIGCCGFISDEANFAPEMMVALHKAGNSRNMARAKELYQKLRPLVQFIWSRDWPARIYAVKQAMRLRGLPSGEATRLPVHPYSDEEDKQLNQILVDLGLIKDKR